MQKTLLYILLVFIGLSGSFFSFGQVSYPAEKAGLWTDRSVFICGEDILFSGYISSADPINNLSEVVYVELISPNGLKVNQAKINITEDKFNGQLTIHPEILSGYYFLRAYTKWMRNGQPEDYTYVRLKLINPLNADILEVNDSLIDESIQDQKERVDAPTGINLDKETYSPGEPLIVSWNQDKVDNACMSIIPLVAKPFVRPFSKSMQSEYLRISFYPETRGISVSGKVIDKQTGKPQPYHKVSAHLKDKEDFIMVLSDTLGRFYMALPDHYGSKELFFSASSLENNQVEILIDQDFCNREVNLTVPPFVIDSIETTHLLKMAQIHQLYSAYKEEDSFTPEHKRTFPFYGEANKTIDFDEYILLDSLELYFTDLTRSVMIKKNKGKRSFAMGGTQPEIKMYEPLILVDWVPIDDAERILKMDPGRIRKIEIINQTYFHGGIIYGGIINVISRNSDFAGLEFPTSGMYLNYDFFSHSDYSDKKTSEESFLFTNTYEWIPDVQSLQQPQAFIAPPAKGDYLLVVQGVGDDGENIIISQKFSVE